MRKYDPEQPLRNPAALPNLLRQRRSPLLSEAGCRKVLEDLTNLMVTPVSFVAAFFPKKGADKKTLIFVDEIDSVDLMMDQEGRRFLPAFTTYEGFQAWKPALRPNEVLYVVDKQDLLSFLSANGAVTGVVVNPYEDDLILDIPTLTNLLTRYRTEYGNHDHP